MDGKDEGASGAGEEEEGEGEEGEIFIFETVLAKIGTIVGAR